MYRWQAWGGLARVISPAFIPRYNIFILAARGLYAETKGTQGRLLEQLETLAVGLTVTPSHHATAGGRTRVTCLRPPFLRSFSSILQPPTNSPFSPQHGS